MIEFINPSWRDKLKRQNSIILTGASGSGKSSILKLMAGSSLSKLYFFPKRYTTRLSRPDDLDSENITISKVEFEQRISSGEFSFYWKKPLPNGETLYGFLLSASANNVYCCNNEIIEFPFDKQQDIFDNSLVIQIYCSVLERTRRISERSSGHSINKSEFLYRTTDVKPELLSKVDILVKNENVSVDNVAKELISTINEFHKI